MLPCVCSVIDHRWRQNVVRTKKWHTRLSRVCHWCSYHILTSSVIYYWIRRTATWNLFVLYNNEKPFLFQNILTLRESRPFAPPLPRLCTKKSHLMWSFYSKWSNFIGCYAEQRIVIGREKSRHCQLERRSSLNELTAKAELNYEIYKSWRKCWKNQVSFCHRSSPVSRKAWKLPWKLQELKKYPRKTCGCGQPRGHLIRVLNERSVNDGGDFCLLWLVALKSAWYSVGDTFKLRYCWPWAVVSYT